MMNGTAEDAAGFLGRWDQLSHRLGLTPELSAEAGVLLHEAYTGSGRHYHGIRHILAMLEIFDRLREEFKQPLIVELAIFFHDLIYDASRSDNEARSAEELRKALGSEIDRQLIDSACAMIEATKAHTATGDADTDLLIDLDMAILGSDWAAYARYAEGVMKEYVPVYGEEAYRRGRVEKFLQPVLDGGKIFLTPFFEPLTAQAMDNLRREAALLESGVSLLNDASASEDNPYRSPVSGFTAQEALLPGPSWARRSAPLLGCVTGGCLAPCLFFVYCGLVLGDTGGPLFWPILAAFTGIVGLGIGIGIRAGASRRR